MMMFDEVTASNGFAPASSLFFINGDLVFMCLPVYMLNQLQCLATMSSMRDQSSAGNSVRVLRVFAYGAYAYEFTHTTCSR